MNVLAHRAGRTPQQPRERRIDALGLTEAKPRMEDGLNSGLCPRQPTPSQVGEVTDDRRRLLADGTAN